MTEFVDERQRLDERAQMVAHIRKRAGIASTSVIADEIERGKHLASPSEGNKKGDEDWHRFNDNGDVTYTRKSRPQEQPRKATEQEVEVAKRSLDDTRNPPTWQSVEAALNAVFALSVSPAAAQGWQTIETAPKDGTHILARGVRGEASPPTTVHWFGPPDLPGLRAGGWYISVQQNEGPRVHPTAWMPLPAVIAAAPPSPAAQEQEKGEQP